ncbi:MAG TPA: hypothetical protein VMC06_05795 [Opitutaceae bacterium]|nr:hypothetical protein [Opitutaceae bacterium]
MKTLHLRLVFPALFALGLVYAFEAHASPEIRGDSDGAFSFSLMPKAFQKKPQIDMTVFTTVTDAGRLVAPASPDHPVYYVSYPGGFREFGGAYAGVHPPPVADLERVMKKALASQGYLPVTDTAHRPSVFVVFTWGMHSRLDPNTEEISPQAAVQNMLERAALVGGTYFANQVGRAYEERALSQLSGLTFTDASFNLIDPVHRLTEGNVKAEYLMYQIQEDIYFVVASAYDYASVAQRKRTLLWRTNMTVNSYGVNMKETLPPLIATAAPFFGHETAGPEALQRHINRYGQVDIGQPTVVEYMDSSAPAAAPKAAPAPTKPDTGASKP